MSSPSVKTISHKSDLYEVFYRDNLIIRIVLYPNGLQQPKEVLFKELKDDVKGKILSKLSNKEQ